MATLVSLNVGMPKNVEWQGKTVWTGVWKSAVEGPRMVRRLNVDGDGQGDLGGHGGEIRAVLAYQVDSYRHWQEHFGRDDFAYGAFGENFTVDGLPDHEVCIGDRYRIGTAEFEVTQPRVTCYRVGMRMGEPELPSLLVGHRRPGFYLRVITEGMVEAGDEIVRTRVGPEALTVADVDGLLYLPNRDEEKLRATLRIPALSPGWQQSFRELVDKTDEASGEAAADGVARPGWTGFRPLEVQQVVRENQSVVSVLLSGDNLPPYQAGQYLTVRVPGPAVRSYSLSSAPGGTAYRISVKRDGLASSYIHEQLTAGMTLDVAAPRGDFVLEDDDGPVLLVSGGIGITPVLAMLHTLATDGKARPVWWIHVTRDPAFTSEVDGLLDALPEMHRYVYTHGRPTPDELRALGIPKDATAYICGPAAFMDDLRELLADSGIAPDHIHTELFGTLPPINPGLIGQTVVPPHAPAGEPGTGPLITFARSGLSVPWSEQYGSLLELAEACDVPARWSCRTGVCHTCVTDLVAGDVAYSPDPLEPAAPGQVLPCCARPADDVVIDL
ncbi:MOSC and FAD-binding oxidoreductase domain-containing protein [Kribbella italica]|uniref:Ferredoxin-NADP reductase/MOSC domain-containing protein YiiM n=1 Tax=Kribbella italica TaxID=1540520 RepID=A0A7W9MY84_9ACTN|nr:MOSC and FAD-binding oxidoreductase domain-containing protein [Kribbella italica]MBB5840150.1 ferredoxin-NADP reductase/MOSC domain-containing protein YiiM [Kribbella italica]